MAAPAFDIDDILAKIDRLPRNRQREALALLEPEITIRPHTEYQTDPIGWAHDKLGIPAETLQWSLNPAYQGHAWDGTPDPLATAFEAIRDWKDAAIESGTGTGKSYGVAILILWFLACFEDAECYTFAPTEDQLKLYIWKNIGDLWPRFQPHFPTAELTSLTIRMRGGIDEKWSAHGRPVAIRTGEDVSTRAAGMHAEHMLLVYEETPGIDKSVMVAGKNTCTAPHNLRIAIGNPNHQLDSLHQMTSEAGVVAVRMSALDHPNVVTGNANLIPGAVSSVSIKKRLADYGETSPVYQSRVRGVSPEQASDALIRLEWLKAAAARYEARKRAGTLPVGVTGKGVDVANSEHGDRACIVDFADNVWTRVEAFQCPDANALGRKVVLEMQRSGLSENRVGVDAIGVGAGTVNEARRLGQIVQALYAGGPPMQMVEKAPDGQLIEWSPDVNMFKNLRSQMYWQAREDLRLGLVDGPEDKELWAEMIAPTFDDNSKVVVVEPKDEIRAKLGRSPDKADAWVMANWVRVRAVVPTVPQEEEGKSLGYDYAKRKPRERTTGESLMQQWLGEGSRSPTANRYRVPVRRG